MSTGTQSRVPTLWTDLVGDVLIPANPLIKETP